MAVAALARQPTGARARAAALACGACNARGALISRQPTSDEPIHTKPLPCPAHSADDGNKIMYLLKEDFAYVMAHVSKGHTSQDLLRAVLASTLWDTIVTVGPDPLLGLGPADIKSMNTIVNKWVGCSWACGGGHAASAHVGLLTAGGRAKLGLLHLGMLDWPTFGPAPAHAPLPSLPRPMQRAQRLLPPQAPHAHGQGRR